MQNMFAANLYREAGARPMTGYRCGIIAAVCVMFTAAVCVVVVEPESRFGHRLELDEETQTTPMRMLQELASAPRNAATVSRMRADLNRLARDIDASDQRSAAKKDSEGLGMGQASAQSVSALLARHTTTGALRQLDHATSSLLEKWLGGARKPHQLRDELAFGAHAYKRAAEREDRHGERLAHELRKDNDRRRGESERDSSEHYQREADERRGDERRLEHRHEGEDRVHEPREHIRREWGEEERRDRKKNMGGHGIREKEGREGDLTMESAEHTEEARVQKFFTSKAEALQRLYRKEQLELKYQAEYLQNAPVPTQMHAPSAFPSAASAEHPSVARYDSYRARQKQRMERAFAHAQEKHAQHEEGVDGEESERREPAQGQREVGVAHRRRVVELEPAAERDVWSSEVLCMCVCVIG